MILRFFGFSWSFFWLQLNPWEVLKCGGVKPMLSPNLLPLEELWQVRLGDAGGCWEMLGDAGRLEVLVFPIFVQVGQHRRASDTV